MKVVFFSFFALFFMNSLHAQKHKYRYDDETQLMYVDDVVYGKMLKTKGDDFGITKNFSIQNLKGEELVYMKYTTRQSWNKQYQKYESKIYYDINFTQSGARASVMKGFGLGEKGAIKLLVTNNLISGSEIDPVAEARYIKVHNGSYPAVNQISNQVESKSPIVINGNEIIQNGKVLGKFLERKVVLDSSEELFVLTVYSEAGEKIGVAELPVIDPIEWNVETFSDGKITGLLYESPREKERLFEWLVDKKYLN